MAKYQDIDNIIHKIRNNATQSFYLKDNAFTEQFSNRYDLREILELLNTTNDINLQIKLFSALSACLMFSKDTNIDVIIKSSLVYDKIYNVLIKGLPRKATEALNFLSALLYVDAEDGTTKRSTSLALYAKNMTRISGCLGVMADMFTNCMMYHDTWKSLCQCLAIACSGCEINQSYCTHLIPACIRKCCQANIDIFLVLQSLMLNHNRNIQVFLDCDGTVIFTRELLHYDKSLQLLTTVVQFSGAMSVLLRNSKVLDDLHDFVRLYGTDSQIGQKAMIILNYIELRSRDLSSPIPRNTKKGNSTSKIECRDDLGNSKGGFELDDTKTLMQNVLKEVFNYKQNEQLKKTASNIEVNSLIESTSAMFLNAINRETHKKTLNRTKKLMDQRRRNRLHCNIATELSFSFLENHYKGLNRNKNHLKNKTTSRTKECNSIRSETDTLKKKTKTQTLSIENDLSDFYTLSDENYPINLKEFRPISSSTPKQEAEISNQKYHSKNVMLKSNMTTQSQATQQRTAKVEKRTRKKVQRNEDKNLRNRSLSSRFFSAINDSCTTLVKTVANIFKKKTTSDSYKDTTGKGQSHSLVVDDNPSCSYSFLNYMKKRDAILNNNLHKRKREYTDFSLETKSCETCDDTEVLKKKMTKDENLKQTVKKLKLGINMYGCDFKKISRTMWPHESYMTPVVLYNLYRKLLLK